MAGIQSSEQAMLSMIREISVLSQFDVQLADNKTTFLPGQRIEGFVSVKLNTPFDIRLLRVRFCGVVATHLQKADKSRYFQKPAL